MKLSTVLLALPLALAAVAAGAASTASPSPFDTHPACTERTTDPDAPECLLPDDGQPRQLHPPRRSAPPKPPAPPPAPGSGAKEFDRPRAPAH